RRPELPWPNWFPLRGRGGSFSSAAPKENLWFPTTSMTPCRRRLRISSGSESPPGYSHILVGYNGRVKGPAQGAVAHFVGRTLAQRGKHLGDLDESATGKTGFSKAFGTIPGIKTLFQWYSNPAHYPAACVAR